MADAPLAAWPADHIERRPIGALALYGKNARTHSDSQVEGIMASMREWGWTNPVLVDEAGEVIAGHGRIMAAERLGAGYDSVPVMVARGWTEKQIRAYRLADNQLALNSAWDVKLLAAELEALPGMDALIGFAPGQLEDLLKAAEEGEGEGRPLPTEEEAKQTLAERFGLPPFSVLNARDGWWQDRKRAWIALGIESEIGRGENLLQESLPDRVRVIMGVTYAVASAWVAGCRESGLDEAAILAAAAVGGTHKEQHPKKKPARAGAKLTMSATIQREKPHADKALDGDRRRDKAARKIYPARGQDLVKKGYQKNGGGS